MGDSAKTLICLINFPIHVDNLVGFVCWICNSGSENVEDKVEGVEDIKVVENVLPETGKLWRLVGSRGRRIEIGVQTAGVVDTSI